MPPLAITDPLKYPIENCRFCETVLVGAEQNVCDPCADELCAACRENLVEFHTPGLPAQLCNDCHDEWIEWDDAALPERPLESDIQESHERFLDRKRKGTQ